MYCWQWRWMFWYVYLGGRKRTLKYGLLWLAAVGVCINTAYALDIVVNEAVFNKKTQQSSMVRLVNGQDNYLADCDVISANLAQMGYQVAEISNQRQQGRAVLYIKAMKHGRAYQIVVDYPSLKILRIVAS